MSLHRLAVLLGSQIQHKIRLRDQLPGQAAAPELIQVLAAVHRQLCLHFQPVGGHAVEGPQQTIEAREDAQVLPEVVQVSRLHHAGGHVAVLNALVGENRRSEITAQVHLSQPLYVQFGDGVIALPEDL